MKWLAALLLCVTPLWAMEFVSFNHSTTLSAATIYGGMHGGTVLSSTEYNVECLVPLSFDVVSVSFYVDDAPGSGNSRTIQVRKNGSNEFGCTISNSEVECTGTGSASYVIHDAGAVVFTSSGLPLSTDARWTVTFSTEDEVTSFHCGSTLGNNMLSGGTGYYCPHAQNSTPGTDEFPREMVIAAPGTVSDLYVDISRGPGVGKTRTFTFRKNSSDTSTTCAISGNNTDCWDTANSFTVVPGDAITLKEVITGFGSPRTATGQFAFEFSGDRPGDYQVPNSVRDNATTSTIEYSFLQGSEGLYTATEANVQQAGNPRVTLRRILVEANLVPGGFGHYDITVRQAGSDTDLDCTLGTFDTECQGDGHVVVTSGDKLGKEYDPVGSPTGTPIIHGTVLAEVPTRRRW